MRMYKLLFELDFIFSQQESAGQIGRKKRKNKVYTCATCEQQFEKKEHLEKYKGPCLKVWTLDQLHNKIEEEILWCVYNMTSVILQEKSTCEKCGSYCQNMHNLASH